MKNEENNFPLSIFHFPLTKKTVNIVVGDFGEK